MLKNCRAEYIEGRMYWDKDHVYQANGRLKALELLLAAYEHWTAGMILAEAVGAPWDKHAPCV